MFWLALGFAIPLAFGGLYCVYLAEYVMKPGSQEQKQLRWVAAIAMIPSCLFSGYGWYLAGTGF
jgi:hypothetical protein